jgi:hypothetical protein
MTAEIEEADVTFSLFFQGAQIGYPGLTREIFKIEWVAMLTEAASEERERLSLMEIGTRLKARLDNRMADESRQFKQMPVISAVPKDGNCPPPSPKQKASHFANPTVRGFFIFYG